MQDPYNEYKISDGCNERAMIAVYYNSVKSTML